MSIVIQVENEKLDKEWVFLIMVAREMGITLQEIRSFFEKNSSPVHQFYK
jgi:DNA-binding transcriptional MerR regulator